MTGEIIRQRRKARTWSQEKLAREVGISQNYISDIEKGKRTGTVDILQAIADVLDLTLDELMQNPNKADSTASLGEWTTAIVALGPELSAAERASVLEHAQALRDRRRGTK